MRRMLLCVLLLGFFAVSAWTREDGATDSSPGSSVSEPAATDPVGTDSNAERLLRL